MSHETNEAASPTPEPRQVREIAREHIRSGRADVGTTIVKHFGSGALSDEEFWAWECAVEDERRKAKVTVSWPGEQPQRVRDGDEAATDLRGWLDACRREVAGAHDRPGITPNSCYCDLPRPCEDRARELAAVDGLIAVLDGREQLAARVAELEAERDGRLAQAFANGWHDAIAAHRTPGWGAREAAWRKFREEVRAAADELDQRDTADNDTEEVSK